MKPWATIEKKIGETPLEALERLRQKLNLSKDIPMAYAGRLDPMASGKLLILIGDECKQQTQYHGLDKAYRFSVLFGVGSDTQDVLGRLTQAEPQTITSLQLQKTIKGLSGPIALPYPHFSSKTVDGKPLHTWTLEDRLDEIEIPTNHSFIYELKLVNLVTKDTDSIYRETQKNIDSIPPVTDARKALGADFRRNDVRADWSVWKEKNPNTQWPIATFECVCSSGTYMRSLAALIGNQAHTQALAYSIHRTKIGTYMPLPFFGGLWLKKY